MITNLVMRCHICDAVGDHQKVMEKRDRERTGREIVLHSCNSCGGVFLGSVLDAFDGELYGYYENYRKLTKAQLYSEITRARYIALLDRLGELTEGRSFLDVGCGMGGFVKAATEYGWEGSGIDLAEKAIEIGRSHGLPLHGLDFFSPQLKPASFDLVTMFELIEHVPNPGAFIARARELLKPGGLIYLTTPNFNSLDRRVLGAEWDIIHSEHLNYFTPETLRKTTLRVGGLRVLELRTKNLAVKTVLRLRGKDRPGSVPRTGRERREDLRGAIEGSTVLSSLKKVINLFLRATRLGSSMILLARKEDVAAHQIDK